jgi:hypothetical protein
VLHGEHRGGGAAGGVDLGVDVFHVIAGRLGRDHQSFGYLLVGQAAGEQDQDLDLAGGQACQRFPAPRHPVPGRLEHGVHGRAVQAAGSRSAIRHWRRTCSIGCPNPRSTPSDSAATSSASRARGATASPPTRQA